MIKKRWIAGLTLGLSVCLCSCSISWKPYLVKASAEPIKVSYDATREEAYQAFTDKVDVFSAKLSSAIYQQTAKDKNSCISPISVYMALAMASACAGGETRTQIVDGLGMNYTEIETYSKYLYALANKEHYTTSLIGREKVMAFQELSNSIWVKDGLQLVDTGVDTLTNVFHTDVFQAPFGTPKAGKAIAAYVKEKTHGLIDGNIPLDVETLITIVNTYYLKEVWNDDGDLLPWTSASYDFVNKNGTIENTRLMQGYYNNGKAQEGETFTSFFTKTEHGYKIKFILPKDGYSVDDVFTKENLYAINGYDDYGYIDDENKQLHHTRVFFPEYKASFDDDIKGVLQTDFGITNLFTIKECDLSNILTEKAYCDKVIHRCSVEVNRRGIEGAAMTTMPMAGAPGPLDGYEKVYHDYIVDQAFGFIIVDNYNTVVFSGVVNQI